MEKLGGGCYTPLGIHSKNGYLTAEVLSLDGTRSVRREEKIRDPEEAAAFGTGFRDEAGGLIREAWEKLGVKS